MKHLTILVLLLLSFTCKKEPPISKWDQVYNIVRATKSGHYTRKTQCIMKYSAKYSDDKVYVDPVMVAKIGDAESDHREYLTNFDNTCFGEYQISTNHWLHILYYIDDGKLGKYLHKKNITNNSQLVKYFLRIGYNTESACIILRDNKIRYKTWSNALVVFGGWRTDYGQRHPEKMTNYLTKCLGEDFARK